MALPPPKILMPSDKLRPIIHHYEYYERNDFSEVEIITMYPCLSVGFVFLFYTDQKVICWNRALERKNIPATALIPPTGIPTYNSHFGNLSVLRLIFMPGIINQLYNTPMNCFQNDIIDLGEHLDSKIHDLYERMLFMETLSERINACEQYLLTRCRNIRIKPTLTAATTKIINQKNEVPKVQKLASQLGLCRQQLTRQFRKELGFSAKEFLKIQRFNKALISIHNSPRVSLSHIAYDFGYFDQSHFTHEFKEMTDSTPKLYLESIGRQEYYGDFEGFTHFGLFFKKE